MNITKSQSKQRTGNKKYSISKAVSMSLVQVAMYTWSLRKPRLVSEELLAAGGC